MAPETQVLPDIANVTPPGGVRRLTADEADLARSVFRRSIDLSVVEIRRRRWAFFQPRGTVMAPCGHIHVHQGSDIWREDYAAAEPALAGLFLHELTHVWQWQRGVYLPLARHPFCRYDYVLRPGWRLQRYGLEQQAEIVRHAWLLREGHIVPGAPAVDQYESLLTVFG